MTGETIAHLLHRLERLVAQINEEVPTSKSSSDVRLGDDFQVLKRACMDQTNTVREAIAKRDKTEKSGQGSSVEGIAASAKVRRELNELAVVAERLHHAHQVLAQQGRQDFDAEQGREVEELLKNVEACLEQERRRWGASQAASSPAKSGSAGGAGGHLPKLSSAWRPKRHKQEASTPGGSCSGGGGGGAGGGSGERREVEEGLIAAQERDAAMEGSLEAILSGLGRLKGVALDIEEEAAMQNIMVDDIHQRALQAEADLRSLNARMSSVLRSAGGAGRLLCNVALLLVVLALGLFVYQTVKQHRTSTP